MSEDDFKKKYLAAQTTFARVQVCLKEGHYKLWTRKDKPNISGWEFLSPILDLPDTHPCSYAQRKSGGAGNKFVVEFKYSATIMGANLKLYFKGFFADDWTLKLEIQSLREDEEI